MTAVAALVLLVVSLFGARNPASDQALNGVSAATVSQTIRGLNYALTHEGPDIIRMQSDKLWVIAWMKNGYYYLVSMERSSGQPVTDFFDKAGVATKMGPMAFANLRQGLIDAGFTEMTNLPPALVTSMAAFMSWLGGAATSLTSIPGFFYFDPETMETWKQYGGASGVQ